MEGISSLIYGIIQGITEFLPVSSSGHLALLPHFLGIEDPGVVFDLSMHVGTALAVIVYFFQDIKKLISQSLALLTRGIATRHIPEDCALAFNMMVATVTSVLFILLLKPLALEYGRSPLSMVITLSLFGVFMFMSDTFKKDHDDLFMSTLTISRQMGLGREESTRFSFLLSIPIIFAGFFYKLPLIFKGEVSFDLYSLSIGIIVSFVVGLLTIHYFLKFIKRIGLAYFAFYRVILAGLVYYYLV